MAIRRIVVDVLKGHTVFPPPIWLMRQAGRYLPEYRETRARAGNFLDLCYNPDLAVDVTMQPIRRFGFDASILFSDILVVPHALGRRLEFREGEGPVMEPLDLARLEDLKEARFHEHLRPVYETVGRLREDLPAETTLIGFCGAPWTVATYMLAGRGTPDQAPAKLALYRDPAKLMQLLDILAEWSAEYLMHQISAGADVVQIFDSWSGVLDDAGFDACCIRPVADIVRRVRTAHPDIPIVAFPKGAGQRFEGYVKRTGVTAVGIDWTVPLEQAVRMQREATVQGNLDPLRLVAGGEALEAGVDGILDTLGGGPLVFNLGHGIRPETPIANVEAMLGRIRTVGPGRR